MKFFFLKFKVKFKTRENKLVVYTNKNVFKVSIPYIGMEMLTSYLIQTPLFKTVWKSITINSNK